MRVASALVFSLTLTGVAVSQSLRPSVQDQIRIGRDAKAKIMREERTLPATDPRVIFLREKGAKLLRGIPESERKARPFEYSFDIIDSKEINAFALPGGPIFFFTGLIETMTTEDQLIGVLGHEIVHVRNQHWASQYADNLKRRLGLAIVLGVIGANETLVNVADIVDQGAFMLTYSRRHETEADRVGYDLMIAQGYNPHGMVDVFRGFARGGGRPPEILSTHPDPARRANEIERRLKAEKRPLRAQVNLPFPTRGGRPAAEDPSRTTGPQPRALAHRGCPCHGLGVEGDAALDRLADSILVRALFARR